MHSEDLHPISHQNYQQSYSRSLQQMRSEPGYHQRTYNENQLHQQRKRSDPKTTTVQITYQMKKCPWKQIETGIKDAKRTLEQQQNTLEKYKMKLRTAEKQKEQLEQQSDAYVIKLKKIEVRLQKKVDEMVIIDLKQQSILIDRKLQNLREQILESKAKIQQLQANAMFWDGLINQTQQYIDLKYLQFQRKRLSLTNRRNQNE